MPSVGWTHLIEKQEGSSAGASLKNSTTQWTLSQLTPPLKKGNDDPQAAFELIRPFSITSMEGASFHPNLQALGTLEKDTLWEFLEKGSHHHAPPYWRSIFPERSFQHAFHGTNLETVCLLENPTSDSPQLRLPPEVQKQIFALEQGSAGENALYLVADAVAEWLEEASWAEQTLFAVYLKHLSFPGIRILLSSFSDAEVRILSEELLLTIARLLRSEDKRTAQAAAAVLVECGDTLGRSLLHREMEYLSNIPHGKPIQDILELIELK